MENKLTVDIQYTISTKCTFISKEYAIFEFDVFIGNNTNLASGNLILNRNTKACHCECGWNGIFIIPEGTIKKINNDVTQRCRDRLSTIG